MKPTSGEWLAIAAEDLDAAKAMLRGRRYLYAGFEAQQCAEKALKAVIQEAERVPPKIHDLATLADRAGVSAPGLITRRHTLTEYYIATRYPEDRRALGARTDRKAARTLLDTAEEVLTWARQRLTSTPSSPSSPDA